jgi:hypothetical protein
MPTVIDLGKAKKLQKPGAFDDISDADLGRSIKLKFSQDNPGATSTPYDDFVDVPGDSFPRQKMPAGPEFSWRKAGLSMADQLPAAGAFTVGGIAGALATPESGGLATIPAAGAGAWVGGAGGAVARDMIHTAMGEPPVGSSPASEGTWQMGLTLAGELAAIPVKAAGKAVIESIIGPQGLSKTDAAAVMLREGIAATKGGYNKLVKKLFGISQDIKAATAASTMKYSTDSHVLAPAMQTLMEDAASSDIPTTTAAVYKQLGRRFLRENPAEIDATRLYQIKQSAGQKAAQLYKQISEGGMATDATRAELKYYKALADNARDLLHNGLDPMTNRPGIPGLANLDSRASELAATSERIAEAIGNKSGITTKMTNIGLRHAPAAVLGTGAATFVPAASWQDRVAHAGAGIALGEGLSDPRVVMALVNLIKQTPRGLMAAYNSPLRGTMPAVPDAFAPIVQPHRR